MQLETLVTDEARLFETKRSPGGRYDIEYLSAMGLAHSGVAYPLDANTPDRLEILATAGVISSDNWRTLAHAFELYTQVDFLLELQGFSRPNTASKEKKIELYLDRSLELLGIRVDRGVARALVESKKYVREIYATFLEELQKTI